MRLYKFRSLIERALDILINNRLHCAEYETLNDPFGGVYWNVSHTQNLSIGASAMGTAGRSMVARPVEIRDLQFENKTRACSLSASITDVRLWSLYADGHTGVSIQIELEDSEELLNKVDYVGQLERRPVTAIETTTSGEILSKKSFHWNYEKNIELFQTSITYIYLEK